MLLAQIQGPGSPLHLVLIPQALRMKRRAQFMKTKPFRQQFWKVEQISRTSISLHYFFSSLSPGGASKETLPHSQVLQLFFQNVHACGRLTSRKAPCNPWTCWSLGLERPSNYQHFSYNFCLSNSDRKLSLHFLTTLNIRTLFLMLMWLSVTDPGNSTL